MGAGRPSGCARTDGGEHDDREACEGCDDREACEGCDDREACEGCDDRPTAPSCGGRTVRNRARGGLASGGL